MICLGAWTERQRCAVFAKRCRLFFRRGDQSIPYRLFAGKLAGAASRLGFFPYSLLRWLLIEAPPLHFAELGKEDAILNETGGSIVYRFHARDLHLILGPGPDDKPVRFRVTIDGAAPATSHGADVDADGQGIVTGQRLYQLIRQSGGISDHTFKIEFLDPGVAAYAFTFG